MPSAMRKSSTFQTPGESLLEHLSLPAAEREYNKGQVIYGANWPTKEFFLIQKGRVKLSCHTLDITTIIDLYQLGEVFGFGALNMALKGEEAVAMERTIVSAWDEDEITEALAKSPELSNALLHIAVHRMVDYARRLHAAHALTVSERLNQALLSLGIIYMATFFS